MPTRPIETARVPEDISGRPRRIPVGDVTWRHTFRALRHRNYRLFFWGQLVSLIGTWMQQTAMSWFVYQITGSKLLLGAVAAVGSAPMMLFSIWGGALADLYPKRSILVMTQSAQMICAFLLAAGAWAGFAGPIFIIVIAALNGVAMGFDMPARQAFTVEMTSREDLLNAISLNSSIVNGARVVGPSVAGVLIGAVGVAMCFFLNGVTFIAVIAGLLMMRLPPFHRPTHLPSAGEHAWNGIVYSVKHQRVRTILLLFLAVGVFGWSYAVLMPAFAKDVLGRGANGYGPPHVGQRNGRLGRRTGRCDVGTLFHSTQTRSRRNLVVLGRALCFFADAEFLRRARVPVCRRIRNALVFLDLEHSSPDHRSRRNARSSYGGLDAGFWRDDSARQRRSWGCCPLVWDTVRAGIWRRRLCVVRPCYISCDPPTGGCDLRLPRPCLRDAARSLFSGLLKTRAISSVVEHLLHTQGVAGSIPASRISCLFARHQRRDSIEWSPALLFSSVFISAIRGLIST